MQANESGNNEQLMRSIAIVGPTTRANKLRNRSQFDEQRERCHSIAGE